MSDLLRQGNDWLEAQRTAHAASPATYRRGETELAVNATFGKTDYEVEDEYGLRIGAEARNFLMLAADLVATFVQPEPGDQIEVGSMVYEVMSLAGQGCWRWSDPYHTTLRIHTRQVS